MDFTCDLMMSFVNFGEIAFAQQVSELENIVLDFFADRLRRRSPLFVFNHIIIVYCNKKIILYCTKKPIIHIMHAFANNFMLSKQYPM